MASPTPPAAHLLPSMATSVAHDTVTSAACLKRSASLKNATLPKPPFPFPVFRGVRAKPCAEVDTDRELTGMSHASAVNAGTTENHSNTVVPDAAETGAAPAKDAKATRASARAYRRILRAPYPLPNPGNVRQSATAHREVSLVAAGSQPDTEDSERESASVGPPGFIPVVDFDGIPPFSDSDEIETARGLPGSVRRRRKAGRRVRHQAVV